jgi:REP element-mobilizing transposase RayT
MAVIAYMLTFTTHGTWLQGDERGWVKNAKIYNASSALKNCNLRQMKEKPVKLSRKQRIIAVQAIVNEAKRLEQKIFALAVCDNHVHLIVQNINLSIGRVVSHYKNAARLTLQQQGFNGKLWTRGFDKRYCMNDKQLAVKIAYIRNHVNPNAEIIINK